jgi:uncharacterized protein YbaR (Trm112 family)
MPVIRKCPNDGNEYPIKPYRKYCPACHGVLYLQEKKKFGGITMDPKKYLRE